MYWYFISIVLFLVGIFGIWWNNRIHDKELREVSKTAFEAGYRRAVRRAVAVNRHNETEIIANEYEKWTDALVS